MLTVDDDHKLYWVDWGNKNIQTPIFYLHGGPGGGFDEQDFDMFDPAKHRVIFHDQRGSGRSTPFASIKNNETRHLISDITKLRAELGFEKISLYGFSWGSTLALLYAIEQSRYIDKMVIGGIFLARREDRDFYLNGGASSHFPEAWQRFVSNVPEGHRDDVSEYYRQMMFENSDESIRKKFANEWMVYEASLVKLDYRMNVVERTLKEFASESLAYLEAHYILNDCFIEENYILKNVHKLKNITMIIVHGRYDFVCKPSAAYELSRAQENAILHIVQSGHSSHDIVQREAIKAYLNTLW